MLQSLTIQLTKKQAEKLSDFFFNVSQGLMATSFAVPIIAPSIEIIMSIKTCILSLCTLYFSLKLVKYGERYGR